MASRGAVQDLNAPAPIPRDGTPSEAETPPPQEFSSLKGETSFRYAYGKFPVRFFR
jgi:hypothetical protein